MAPVYSTSVMELAALTMLLVAEVAAQGCTAVTSRFQPKMGSGYKVTTIATGLRQPRHIVLDSAGNLLVAEQSGGGVKRLVLKENGDSVCVVSTSALTSDSSVSQC
jgi:hypothetical protein